MKKENNQQTKTENQFQTSEDNRELSNTKEVTERAREEALEDIEHDPDLSIHHPNDDLDEGETARLGEDKTDLV